MIALQLIGSPTSKFFFDLSLLYAKDIIKPNGYKLMFVTAYPDASWSVSEYLHGNLKKIAFDQMISKIKHADIAVPHMFCQSGLTSIRILFEEVLNIPIIGSSGHTANITQNKYLTKLICQDAGITVPDGHLIKISGKHQNIKTISYPLIVKPNNADNSDGLSLVYKKEDLKEALDKCAPFGNDVLMEAYIPGREIRGAIIEIDGVFTVLPFIEYSVSKNRPIRYGEDKLKFDTDGNLISQSSKDEVPSKCPAQLSDDLNSELSELMLKAHHALDCRDFSMYDFRIHYQTNKPYLLETGLFWSFSKTSMISNMLSAENKDLKTITDKIWRQASNRCKNK